MTTYPEYEPAGGPARGAALGLGLVIALSGVLIIRPEEVYLPLNGLRLYFALTVCTLLYYAPSITRGLGAGRSDRDPLLVLVLGLLAAVVASQVTNLQFGKAAEEGEKFFKAVAYYLVLTAALTSVPAVRAFLTALVVFVIAQTTLALLQYHGYIEVEALRPWLQLDLNPDGDAVVIARLSGSGIYNDPNDLCLLLTAGILICLNRCLGGGLRGLPWLVPAGYFGYALAQTQSRGGLLAATAGFAATFVARYGARRTIPILLVLVPVGLAAFGGRQTRLNLSDGTDTAQGRMQLWSEGFTLIGSHPLFGIGAGCYEDRCGLVAHNSFVHAYVELGLFGGGLFLTAFLLALWAVWTTVPDPSLPPEEADELARLRPVILGLLVSYMVGMYSLSRNYVPPTYLNLALATVYVRLAAPDGTDWFRLDRRMLARLVVITVLGFVGLKLFIMAFVRF